MEPINFDDITLIEQEVKIGADEYLLREMDGEASIQHDNARTECYEYDEGKLVKIKNIASVEPLLVSLCLFRKADNTRVEQDIIKKWPKRVLNKLYERARIINRLNDTPDSIKKQIENLQNQLTEIEASEGTAKN